MNSDAEVMPSDTVGQLAWWIDRGEKLRTKNERLRELLLDAYEAIKRLRDNSHQEEYERLVAEIAPHLNLPSFEDVRGILVGEVPIEIAADLESWGPEVGGDDEFEVNDRLGPIDGEQTTVTERDEP